MTGIKLIRGQDRRYENLGGDAGTVLIGRDVFTDISTTLGANQAIFEACALDYTPHYDVYLYVVEGRLTVGAGGIEHVVAPGDAIWIPRETPVIYRAEARTTAFDVYYPVDWRERLRSGTPAPGHAEGSGSGIVLRRGRDRQWEDFTGDGTVLIGRDVGTDISRTIGTNLAVFEACRLEWTTRYDEYMYGLEGQVTFTTRDGDLVLRPNNGIWFPKGTWMVIQAGGKATTAVVVYPVDWRTR
jgi:ethanolamine utilization protein EutQ (cupin superfamily)